MGKERECQQNDSLAAPADTLPFLALSLEEVEEVEEEDEEGRVGGGGGGGGGG